MFLFHYLQRLLFLLVIPTMSTIQLINQIQKEIAKLIPLASAKLKGKLKINHTVYIVLIYTNLYSEDKHNHSVQN